MCSEVFENHPADGRIKEMGNICSTVTSRYGTGGGNIPLVMASGQGNAEICRDVSPSLTCNHEVPIVVTRTAQTTHQVRRLVPVEVEFLQGFPRNYTRIPWRGKPAENCPNGNRYKALGNSMAVPCIKWLGQRIEAVEKCL